MKKLFVLVIATLLTVTIVKAQDGWVSHKADERITVKFPSEPKEMVPGSFITASKDSSIAYVFTLVDFLEVAKIDSTTLAPIKATPEFAAQLKSGIGQSLPDVTLADFTIGTWKGFTSYTSNGLDSKKKRYDMFMFIIGNKLYSLSTIIADGKDTKGRDVFFSSIQLSTPPKK
jgi:hypothetical protein